MTHRKWLALSMCGGVVIVFALAARPGVAGSKSAIGMAAKGTPVAHLTRLQCDVYELVCTYEQLAAFDLDRVQSGPASTADVLGWLNGMGQARLMVRCDKTVDLTEENTISTGERVPIVRDISVSGGGVVTPSVSYEQVGFIATISGVWLDEEDPLQAQVSFGLECSDLSHQKVAVSAGVAIPIIRRRLSVQETRVLRSQQPIWIACNDLDLDAGPDGETRMTLVRLTATRLVD